MNKLKVFDNLATIGELNWERLRQFSHQPNFQIGFPLINQWYDFNKKKFTLVLIAAEQEQQLDSVFPLMKSHFYRRKIIKHCILRFAAFTATDFSTVLSSEENINLTVNNALNYLFENHFHWDKMILDDLEEGNPAIACIENWLIKYNQSYSKVAGKYYYVNLDRTWEDVLKDTSKKFVRRTINLAKNRANKLGEWCLVSNPDLSVDQIIEMARPMHINRQKKLKRQSHFTNPEQELFYKQTLEFYQSNNKLRTYWLQLNNEFIAYLFCIEENNKIYAWHMAFDPEYSAISPSRILLYDLLKQLHKNKFVEFHFMRGETDYKTKWTKSFRENVRFDIYNRSHLLGKINYFLDTKKAMKKAAKKQSEHKNV